MRCRWGRDKFFGGVPGHGPGRVEDEFKSWPLGSANADHSALVDGRIEPSGPEMRPTVDASDSSKCRSHFRGNTSQPTECEFASYCQLELLPDARSTPKRDVSDDGAISRNSTYGDQYQTSFFSIELHAAKTYSTARAVYDLRELRTYTFIYGRTITVTLERTPGESKNDFPRSGIGHAF
jgi:hypothetical protein